jgi:hypothetical protein
MGQLCYLYVTSLTFTVLSRSFLLIFLFPHNLKFVAGSIPGDVIRFSNWLNPSSRNVALVSTQPLTEMSTRNIPGVKGCPARKADNLTAIYELIF